MALKVAGLAFGVLALVAGGLQLWAFGAAGGARHLVLGVFAGSVGACVIAAAWRRRALNYSGRGPARRVR